MLAFVSLTLLGFTVSGDFFDFDCGMRELALEYAIEINPNLSMQQLQYIADALNGSPEKIDNCTITPSKLIQHSKLSIPQVFVFHIFKKKIQKKK